VEGGGRGLILNAIPTIVELSGTASLVSDFSGSRILQNLGTCIRSDIERRRRRRRRRTRRRRRRRRRRK
jgi:hypothetical protein